MIAKSEDGIGLIADLEHRREAARAGSGARSLDEPVAVRKFRILQYPSHVSKRVLVQTSADQVTYAAHTWAVLSFGVFIISS